jgi:hypothetical protein
MHDQINTPSDGLRFRGVMDVPHDEIVLARCEWHMVATDVNTGAVVWDETKENLVTTVGKALLLNRLFGLSSAIAIAGMAVGTSATAATVSDTAITSPAYQVFDSTPTLSGLVVTAVTTYATGSANINIQEVGLLTASGGVLFNHLAPIGPFSKTTAVTLQITITITQS